MGAPEGIPKCNEPMRFTSETTSKGVSERLFTLGDASAWSGHLPMPSVAARWCCWVTAAGSTRRPRVWWPAPTRPGMAIGCAPSRTSSAADLRQRMASGEPVGPHVARYNTELSGRAVPEWQATLDALQGLDIVGADGPVGFWGVSHGSAIGVPFATVDARITAAVFGLASHETLAEAAAQVTVPVEFLLQWDDELVARDSGLALFGAFASGEKTLHANPGRHTAVPAFELDSSARFFLRHLVAGGHPR